MPFARFNRIGNREGSMTQIHGEVAEGFGAVADAFADNFDDHGAEGAIRE